MILAGDVGGTKTHLALYEPGSSVRAPVLERRLPSRERPQEQSSAASLTTAAGSAAV